MHTWLGFEWYYTMPCGKCTAPGEKNFFSKSTKKARIITFPCHMSLEKIQQIINNKHRGVYRRANRHARLFFPANSPQPLCSNENIVGGVFHGL